MGELSIKIKLADREYPMRVAASEEERLRKAGKMLNEKLKQFRDQFGIDDKQDLFAMCAFDTMVEKMRSESEIESIDSHVSDKVVSIEKLISSAMTTWFNISTL